MIPKARARTMGWMFAIFFALWGVIALVDPSQRADFYKFVAGTTVGIAALVLREMSPQPPAPPAPPKEPSP